MALSLVLNAPNLASKLYLSSFQHFKWDRNQFLHRSPESQTLMYILLFSFPPKVKARSWEFFHNLPHWFIKKERLMWENTANFLTFQCDSFWLLLSGKLPPLIWNSHKGNWVQVLSFCLHGRMRAWDFLCYYLAEIRLHFYLIKVLITWYLL